MPCRGTVLLKELDCIFKGLVEWLSVHAYAKCIIFIELQPDSPKVLLDFNGGHPLPGPIQAHQDAKEPRQMAIEVETLYCTWSFGHALIC